MKRPRSALQKSLAEKAKWAEHLRERLFTPKPRPKRADIDIPALLDDIGSVAPERQVRDPGSRKFAFKTSDIGKIRIVIAHHLYGRYAVPSHLEAIWRYSDTPDLCRSSAQIPGERSERLTLADVERRRSWFVTAASGGSLHKAHTRHFLSKRETHAFLTIPCSLTFQQALVFAMARSYSENLAYCRRLAGTKLARKEYVVDEATPVPWRRSALFWKDAVRFFCAHAIAGAQVDDLVDFFTHKRQHNETYDLKGRTLQSVTAAMHEWHADLGRLNRIGDFRWDGIAIPDGVLIKVRTDADSVLDWQFAQVKTSKDLAEEGNAMRHCVYTYQPHCLSGAASIWSMRSRNTGSGSPFARKITFELENPKRRIVQVRGYANRRPDANEIDALRRWAGENAIGISPYAWT